jgi:aminoglycoside phosphotransferase (APT) family kinase protein
LTGRQVTKRYKRPFPEDAPHRSPLCFAETLTPSGGAIIRTPVGQGLSADLIDSVRRETTPIEGYHNQNYSVAAASLGLPSEKHVLLRVRQQVREVVERIWPDESELLTMLAAVGSADADGRGVEAPRVAARNDGEGIAVLDYVEGRTLEELAPSGKPVPARWVDQIPGFFGRLVGFRACELPQLPKDWPDDGDSTAFLGDRVRFTQERVADANEEEFGRLFRGLGIPADAMERFGARLPGLTPRPFTLLHTDVHRRNIVVDGDDRLRFIDWEHAMFGDPLHDLATHLRRMRYPLSQERQVVDAWRQAVGSAWRKLGRDLDRDLDPVRDLDLDLPHYLDYERAQSVYPDVIRAALDLGDACEEGVLHDAVLRTDSALRAAAGPLRSESVPTCADIGALLREWHRNRPSAA